MSLIACSLTTADLNQRVAAMAEIGRAALLGSRTTPRRAELRFAATARERLDGIVAAEAQCCAFLSMAVTDEPDATVLTIDAPEGAEPVLEELVGAFTPRSAGPRSAERPRRSRPGR